MKIRQNLTRNSLVASDLAWYAWFQNCAGFFHELLKSIKLYYFTKLDFIKPELACESRYLRRNIGPGSEVPTKRNIFSHPEADMPDLPSCNTFFGTLRVRGGGG